MSDLKEALSVINRVLPNFNTFIKVVLKKENLSEEAESYRTHYEVILKNMEEGPPLRPLSLIGDDDSGYHSTKPKGGFLPDQIPSVYQAGFLLKRDDKYRWHRYWCRVDGKDMKFSIFNDSNEETLIKRLPLGTVTSLFGPPQTTECDKENCFIISGMVDGGSEGENGSSEEIHLAAYSDADYQQWHTALSLLTGTRESVRMSSASFVDSSHWGALPSGNADTVSTSSSNFSSNRESMISTTSSLPFILRLPSHDSPPRGRSPLEQGVSAGDASTLSSKQLQPLPSPPPEDGEEEDNASIGTIYENVDNLVMQFDSTMQATVQAMGQVGQQLKSSKKHKKKERSLLRQTSFFKGSKSQKSKLSSKQKSELEKGESHSGYLYKRSASGSWKKKWCVLKGAVLSYSKNPEDAEGREYVVLDAQLEKINDPKRSFAFTVQLRGVPEPLCFGTEDEQIMNDWITRLANASVAKGDFNWDEWREQGSIDQPGHYDSQTSLDSTGMSESLYNVPRSILVPEQSPQDTAPDVQVLTAADAIDSGIYSAPRSLSGFDGNTFTVQGQSFALSSDPYAQYDVPRPISLTPDEEAIYDYPENVVDMEIYDYPPDALSFLPPPPDMCPNPIEGNRSSVITLTSDFIPSGRSSLALPEEWSHMTLPPPPVSLSASRPSIAISTTSSDEYYQSARNSMASLEGLCDRPRSQFTDTLMVPGTEEPESTDTREASMEFGTCVMRGYLFKKERFSWNKMYCLIRNSFLECHKPGSSQGPTLKLFLPRSSVRPDKEVKRQWAFKVKHPRREGVLQFAAENEEEYRKWMAAFNSAAAIEVQSVNTVEEIRITDTDMQNRWTTLERNTALVQPPDTNEIKTKKAAESGASSGRRNTYSAGDEYMSDTLKRRRKFSWIKNLSKKRGMHHSTVSVGQLKNGPHQPKQQSVENGASFTTTTVAQEDRACHITTEEGVEQFQGYLKVQRKGADNMWVRYWCVLEDLVISCFVSKGDLSLTLSIQLKGSRVADALRECRHDFSFKIWHLESGQCLFFAADDSIEYGSWFKEITKGAEYVVPLDAGISNSPLSAPFYHYPKDATDSSASQRSSRSSIASLPEIEAVSAENDPASSGGTIFHKGNLKKFTQNKWKDRYCVIKDAMLHIYTTATEKSLLSSVPLSGCKVELVNVPNEEIHHYTFRVSPSSGKAHMFSAASEQEMYTWAITLQDCSHRSTEDPSTKGNKTQNASRPKEVEELVSYVAANKLTNPVYAGYTEVLLTGSWNRFWSVVHTGCLYLYQHQESHATVRTIVLKGYGISVGGPQGCKKPCVITLQYPGTRAVYMAVSDQIELTKWFNTLEHGTKMEGLMRQRREVMEAQKTRRVVQTDAASRDPTAKTKKPMKPEQSNEAPPQNTKEEPKKATEERQHQNTIIRRYEKKIRKTHRVANLTEQNLKQQQTSLMHFKRELSRLIVKLQELADKGDEHAVKRLKNIHVKLQQIDKIIPYIGKYIMVNRQAEIQTVAILKESCTVDMQRFKTKGDGASLPPASLQRLSGLSLSSTESHDSTPDTATLRRLGTHLETHLEEAESNSNAGTEPPTPLVDTAEPPSQILRSSLLESDQAKNQPPVQIQASTEVSVDTPVYITESEQLSPLTKSADNMQSALLDQPQVDLPIQKASDPPYANLVAIRAEVMEIQEQMSGSATQEETDGNTVESPYATLASVRPGEKKDSSQEVQYAELKTTVSPTRVPSPKSPSNYAELDFTRMQRATPTSPSSRLNYIQVDFDPSRSKMVLVEKRVNEDSTSAQAGDGGAMNDSVDGNSLLDKTLTPENVGVLTSPPTSPMWTSSNQPPKSQVSASTQPPKSRMSAMQDAIKLFEPSNSSTPIKAMSSSITKSGPPPTKKKPKQHSSSQSSFSAELSPSPSHSSKPSSDKEVAEDQSEHVLPPESAIAPNSDSGDHTADAQSVTAGTMSVMERIKVLQKQNT